MSRKKSKQAVPDEVLAEGSGPVEVVVAALEAEPAKPSKKKFSKKKAPKAKMVAASSDGADSEVLESAEIESADELSAVAEDTDQLRAEGELRAEGDDSATDAEELRADGDDSEIDADELRVDGASPDADVLRADGDDSAADELRADGDSHDDADGLRAGDISEPDAASDESSDNTDQLRTDGDGDPVVDGDDVVGAPITDEAGVEAALLPGGLSAVQLRHLIEALIFATDKPVTLQRLRQLTRVSDVARIESALAELQEDYKDRGIALQQVSGGYQFRTNTNFSSWVQQLIAGRPVRLSRAQLETLAIVAYRQPITRPEIDEIRGVDSSNTLRLLLERSLIRVLGKREEVGRPTLYGTTKEFLDFFSLGDLRELPTLREYSELTAESRQVMSDRLGVPLDANGELEPELSDEIDPDQLEPDSASIVDSILAEHAAAEARYDASAIAEAAMSGGSSFGDVADDDVSLSGGEMSTFGSRLPASEARSYVDAIRASVVESDDETDDVELAAFSVADELMSESREPHLADAPDDESMSVADELMSESREPHMTDASDESNSMSASDEPHVGHDDSESIAAASDPHVGNDESMTASEPYVGDRSESMASESEPHVGNDESMLVSELYVGDHSESMASASEPHVGNDESMTALEPHVGHDDSSAGDSMSVSDMVAGDSAPDEPHVGHATSQSHGDMNSADSDLDVEPDVGHNAPVTHEPDNDDPESSGN